MSEHHFKEEILSIFKEIEVNPTATQRGLSKKLNISLGKINYLLKELLKKGLIEARNFVDGNGKLRKIRYILTKEGLKHKVKLMLFFLELKEREFNQLRDEYARFVTNNNSHSQDLSNETNRASEVVSSKDAALENET